MDEWKREGGLLYTLMHHGWKQGQEVFRNRVTLLFQFDRTVSEEEQEEAISAVLAVLRGGR